jgi:hypothetical protein
VITFRDEDEAFLDWISAHTHGYVVNANRIPKAGYLIVHTSTCPHFDRSLDIRFTHEYVKVCSQDLHELVSWAENEIGGSLQQCSDCFG